MNNDTESKHKQEQEANEISLLTNEGFTFSVKGRERATKRTYLFGLIKSYHTRETSRHYTIKPPTLGTLLRIAQIGLQLPEINSPQEEEQMFDYSWRSIRAGAEKMARVIATALNVPHEEEEEQTRYLLENLTPKDLFEIVQRIYISSNLADFINSTRLVKNSRPTEPQRVEKEG